MVTALAALLSFSHPSAWLGPICRQKGRDAFMDATLLWWRPSRSARASSHGWPVGAVSQPTPARGRIPSLGRIIIIAS